ncbi:MULTISPECIES: DUF3836 domain-containing protein [Dysgonomonas]|jgi:hypothetical protein|uniref:Uncharacterized protein n=1 Tax=Dysgonomonas gadei ATCC BAA-286 TaxID=742766 RepID=F5J321_9BACT|nr:MULTISPECIES: DUF3836 domain-containing protein [Dysgonomonas]EGJ99865.1 hypothetical protein HMPREF9455_03738 [Dysgonomonas gadei ATCC BAA-286]MBF0650187.1 DUF3836 domain-containing protein [Dysgonomonas sp. GY75]
MKAIILTSVLTAFLSVTSLYAGEPKTKVYSNEETSATGVIKELISYDTELGCPIDKAIYHYNPDGLLQKKTLYKWDRNAGWIGSQKYDYECNGDGKIINLIYTEWNDKLNTWSCRSEQLVHIYDTEGELLATKQIHINNDSTYLMSQK